MNTEKYVVDMVSQTCSDRPRWRGVALFGMSVYLLVFCDGTATPPMTGKEVSSRPLVIGHRGSSGVLPEHSLAAYQLAIEQGADYVECDICITKDLQLICLHESWLDSVTDAAKVFANHTKTTNYIPRHDVYVTDHFSFDFTVDELRQLRLRQRRASRDPKHNGCFTIPTFDEYIAVVKSSNRTVGIYPEVKDPRLVNGLEIMRSANTTLEQLLAAALARHGYTQQDHPCQIQSFNTASLRLIANHTGVRLIQLVEAAVPTMQQLQDWAPHIHGIGIAKSLLTTLDSDGHIVGETGAVEKAHSAGLAVHAFPFRNDGDLAWNFHHDPYAEFEYFIHDLHIDGLFTDFPNTLTRFLACGRG